MCVLFLCVVDAELIEDKDEPELAMLVDADSVSQAGDVGLAPVSSLFISCFLSKCTEKK